MRTNPADITQSIIETESKFLYRFSADDENTDWPRWVEHVVQRFPYWDDDAFSEWLRDEMPQSPEPIKAEIDALKSAVELRNRAIDASNANPVAVVPPPEWEPSSVLYPTSQGDFTKSTRRAVFLGKVATSLRVGWRYQKGKILLYGSILLGMAFSKVHDQAEEAKAERLEHAQPPPVTVPKGAVPTAGSAECESGTRPADMKIGATAVAATVAANAVCNDPQETAKRIVDDLWARRIDLNKLRSTSDPLTTQDLMQKSDVVIIGEIAAFDPGTNVEAGGGTDHYATYVVASSAAVLTTMPNGTSDLFIPIEQVPAEYGAQAQVRGVLAETDPSFLALQRNGSDDSHRTFMKFDQPQVLKVSWTGGGVGSSEPSPRFSRFAYDANNKPLPPVGLGDTEQGSAFRQLFPEGVGNRVILGLSRDPATGTYYVNGALMSNGKTNGVVEAPSWDAAVCVAINNIPANAISTAPNGQTTVNGFNQSCER